MSNYFGFINETGVLHNNPDQRFFTIGLLKCEDTLALCGGISGNACLQVCLENWNLEFGICFPPEVD